MQKVGSTKDYIMKSIKIFVEKQKLNAKNIFLSLYKEQYKRAIREIELLYSDYWIFMPMHCLGDLLLFCKNIKAFKALNNGKVLIIVKDNNRKKFVECFSSIDKVITMEENLFFYGMYAQKTKQSDRRTEKGKVNIINADHIAKNANIKFKSIDDLYKYPLNLSTQNSESEFPVWSKADIDEVEKCFRELNLGDNTILLSPFAKSLNYKILSKNFWLTLAKALTDSGFDVVFNASTKQFPKYKCIFLPISQMPIFAKKCYSCITFRSGLVDIIACENPQNFFVIYPKTMTHPQLANLQKQIWTDTYDFDENISYEENLYNIFSLESIVGKTSTESIIFDGYERRLADYLINRLKSSSDI